MEKPQTDKTQPHAKPIAAAPKQQAQDFKHLVRVANTDLDGSKKIAHALIRIKGVSFMYANALCHITRIPRTKIASDLTENEITKIEEVMQDPAKFSVPIWMRNRRKEYETGEDMHLIGQDIAYAVDNDIKRMKKIKAYKGIRHMLGQPVRGQRTKSNFRRNKGKISLGVIKKKTVAPAADDKKK